jgi:hypothetical protein
MEGKSVKYAGGGKTAEEAMDLEVYKTSFRSLNVIQKFIVG